MTDLLVTNGRGLWGGFKGNNIIDVGINVTISNRKPEAPVNLEYGEVEAKIVDGKVYARRNGEGKEENLLIDRLSLSEKKYNVFMEICKLDNHGNDFSQQDAILLTQLNQHKLNEMGIVNIIKDFTKGIIQVVLGKGKNDVLTFDFETKTEKDERAKFVTVNNDTNVYDFAIKHDMDPADLIHLNPHLDEEGDALCPPSYDNADLIGFYKAFPIKKNTKVKVELNYDNCWDDKYKED